jgi:hypothetical protein
MHISHETLRLRTPSPRVSHDVARPISTRAGRGFGVRSEPPGRVFPTIAHRVKLEDFRQTFAFSCNQTRLGRCAVRRKRRSGWPLTQPLPAAALMRRAASRDTRGEGSPAVVPHNAAARCVHPLGLETAATSSGCARNSGRHLTPPREPGSAARQTARAAAAPLRPDAAG